MTAVRADAVTSTGCRVRVIEGLHADLERKHGPGLMLTLDMNEPGDRRHAEVYLDESAIAVISRGLHDSKPRLGYRRPLQCVGHEVAPNSHPEEAEILVAGYSFCYPCGNFALGSIAQHGHTITEVLREIRDGIYEVAP